MEIQTWARDKGINQGYKLSGVADYRYDFRVGAFCKRPMPPGLQLAIHTCIQQRQLSDYGGKIKQKIGLFQR